jgi:hypothetical protein
VRFQRNLLPRKPVTCKGDYAVCWTIKTHMEAFVFIICCNIIRADSAELGVIRFTACPVPRTRQQRFRPHSSPRESAGTNKLSEKGICKKYWLLRVWLSAMFSRGDSARRNMSQFLSSRRVWGTRGGGARHFRSIAIPMGTN